jgi:hypothetical protein
MERIPASERTREKLKRLMDGVSGSEDSGSELVRLAARLIVEEALEGEARDAVGRDYYARGAAAGAGYRNGYRTARLKTAEGAVEYSAPQLADCAEPFRYGPGKRCRVASERFSVGGKQEVCSRVLVSV